MSAPSLSGGASLHADNQGHCKGYCVKKTFQLAIEGKNRDRVLDAAKHEIRKYVKRERQKPLPEGAGLWDFDWRLGGSKETAADLAYAEVMTQIDRCSGQRRCRLVLHRSGSQARAAQGQGKLCRSR